MDADLFPVGLPPLVETSSALKKSGRVFVNGWTDTLNLRQNAFNAELEVVKIAIAEHFFML
jgi:hypothetical protein